MTAPDRCGHTVVDGEGVEQPCDRPATGWRWYQDVEHEDCLEPACDWHANEGGRRMHVAETRLARHREQARQTDRRVEDLEARLVPAEAALKRVEALLDHLSVSYDLGGVVEEDDLRAALKGS